MNRHVIELVLLFIAIFAAFRGGRGAERRKMRIELEILADCAFKRLSENGGPRDQRRRDQWSGFLHGLRTAADYLGSKKWPVQSTADLDQAVVQLAKEGKL